MKRFAIVKGILVSLLFGLTLSAAAQDQHQSDQRQADQDQNARQDTERRNGTQQDRQENPQEQVRPQGQANPDDRRTQEPESGNRKNTTPQSEGTQPQDQQSGDRHMQGRETHENGRTYEGRPENDQQAGVTHEGEQRRIPDQDFRAHFGSQHHFAPKLLQVYQGRPSFSYGGYRFALLAAWPTEWGYDDDDYYVDYVDGEYWLYNVLFPGARVEVMII